MAGGALVARDAGLDVRAVTVGRCSVHSTGTACCRRIAATTSRAHSTFAVLHRARRQWASCGGVLRGETPTHPVLADRGWWHRADRFFCQPVQAVQSVGTRSLQKSGTAARPLLITGATGTLGRAFARICSRRGLSHLLLPRQRLDIADLASVTAAVERYRPWAIVNAAGYVAGRPRRHRYRPLLSGEHARAETLAAVCARPSGARGFSCDLVFDGERASPYTETDAPCAAECVRPQKAEAKQVRSQLHPGALVVRTSSFFGPWD